MKLDMLSLKFHHICHTSLMRLYQITGQISQNYLTHLWVNCWSIGYWLFISTSVSTMKSYFHEYQRIVVSLALFFQTSIIYKHISGFPDILKCAWYRDYDSTLVLTIFIHQYPQLITHLGPINLLCLVSGLLSAIGPSGYAMSVKLANPKSYGCPSVINTDQPCHYRFSNVTGTDQPQIYRCPSVTDTDQA